VFTTTVDTDEIQLLVADLASEDWRARQEARHSLVRLGSRAVAPLVKALDESNDSYWTLRWEAAKALGEIADPAAAPALLRVLEDERDGIRWLAAEGLIAMGRGGLLPLLEALVHRSNSGRLRAGAHHVLRELVEKDPQGIITPVLRALEDIEPVIEVPPAAQAALDALTRAKRA
jgi:HEAT repeat protein